ncbi:phage major capsid protein [Alloscardovia macacae]|uniref:Major capsid protein n=1 Tax=Alloscardovia macacae TaxID=1160091 RepID=A0A261F592_9BIFI|nr:phage major capsid protein [Alloscardovia macacae]OZG54066.1 major capsid protein [Alloscardovia macacae]
MSLSTLINNEAAFKNATAIAPVEAIPSALIMTHSTVMANIEGDQPTARIAYVSVDPTAEITAEGAQINESQPTISELVVGTQKVAELTVITNEAYRHDYVPELIGNSLSKAITAKADTLFLGAPASEDSEKANHVTGLVNYKGIVDGGTLDGSLDAIIDTMSIIAANGGTPSNIVMGFDAWAVLLKLKGADKRAIISPDVANSAEPMLFGVPVTLSNRCPAKTILILDSSEIISAVGEVQAATSSERYFENDSIGLRATFRFGYGILHPNRVAKIAVA